MTKRFKLLFGIFLVLILCRTLPFSGQPDAGFPGLDKQLEQKWNKSRSNAEKAAALFEIGQYYTDQNELELAEKTLMQALDLTKKTKNLPLEARVYNQLGMVFDFRGKMAEAIDYYLKALKMAEKQGNESDISNYLNNLGSAYYILESFSNAEKCFDKSLKINEKLNRKRELGALYSNLGAVKQQIGDELNPETQKQERKNKLTEALNLHKKSRIINLELNQTDVMGIIDNNISVVFLSLQQYDSARVYAKKSIAGHAALQDEEGLSQAYSNLAQTFFNAGKTDSAQIYIHKALKLDQKLHSKEGLRTDLKLLSEIEARKGDYRLAYLHYRQSRDVADSLSNKETREKISNYLAQFEFEKKLYQDSLGKAEELKRTELKNQLAIKELQREQNIQYSGIVIFVMLMLGGFFLMQKVHLPTIWIEGFIFFSALLIFEFLFLFLDPYLDNLSGGMPLYKFVINMLMAVAVFYAHSFFENLMKHRLLGAKSGDGAKSPLE